MTIPILQSTGMLQTTASSFIVPNLIAGAGEHATKRYVEFFTAQIRNKGTRQAYGYAARRFFSWCENHQVNFLDIEPIVVATYIEQLTGHYSAPTVKLHLAAIRMLFDYLVTGHVVVSNPASAVKGPKYSIKKGKTPVLTAKEARELLDSIDISSIAGLRDRALIAVMVYSFARVSATLGMNVEDAFTRGRRMWFRLHEKGGKYHEVPAHHNAEQYVHDYLLSLCGGKRSPLFRTLGPDKRVTGRRMHRTDALRMIKRRANVIGLQADISCHSFRATGITTYLENCGSLEQAMQIAAHESARTTKLYDRSSDAVSLDEIERIRI